MSSPTTQVLIVGAGPTGLSAAAILTKLGVKVRIIDKNAARSDKSKALGVQAGTLECLKAALDPALVEKMLEAGRPTREAWFHFGDAAPVKVDLSAIPSEFNFILILAQSETERILEEYLHGLGVTVERNTELTDTKDVGNEVVSTVRFGSGEMQKISSSFVIGADGAHSAVRRLSHIPFKGGAYSGDFILGDVALSWQWPYESVQMFISQRGMIAAFPLKGVHRYRLILIPLNSGPAKNQNIELAEFQSVVEHLSRGQIKILDASWLTRFSVHRRIAQQFQKGRLFLAGDAAHIHSPAGGQGMNTGIQDALNLSFKIQKILADKLPLSALEQYEKERLPVAKQVLRATDFVFKIALLPETTPVRWLRQRLVPKVVNVRWIQRRVVKAISEVSVARKEIERYKT